MPTLRFLVLCAVSLAACNCGDDPAPLDGSTSDSADDTAELDGIVVGDAPELDAPELDAMCSDLGAECTLNDECCSGRCDGGLCVAAACFAQGTDCTLATECCSGLCDTVCQARAACATFGSSCTGGADCCSSHCANAAGGSCAAGETCSCGPAMGCGAGGDPCGSDGECCNDLCDRPDGAAEGTCAIFGACRTAGEPCGTEGLTGACCSTICLATGGDDVPRCQFLGGCRVQDDLCSEDTDCCSGVCRAAGMTLDGRPINRCANADSCLPVGEVCGAGGASSNCCPNGGGRMGCEATSGGFSRCFGGGSNCVVAGSACMAGGDPCCGEPPGLECTPGTPRGEICCLPDGDECAFGDLCCGGICAPDALGVLRCGQECVPNGGACGSDAECCGCCRDGACTADCGDCTGPNLGDDCSPAGPACCGAPTVTCQGVEFATCRLAL